MMTTEEQEEEEEECNDTSLYYLAAEMNVFTVPINGYLSNVVVLVTMVTNCLVCLVLLKRNMRNATNVILVAMAMSTTLTGIWPVPGYVYFFALGGHVEWVPYSWCFLYSTLTEHLPTVFHTASIWLTVALAVQRYFYVCHSQRAKRWCTMANSVRAAVVIHVFAAALHFTRFIEYQHFPVVIASRLDPAQNVTGCCSEFSPFVVRYQNLYFSVYYCLRVVLIHLVPCTALVLLNALLIHTMRTAQARREVLLKLNRKSESRRLAESNSTTMMLVAVVGVFLLVELPMAVLFILLIVDNSFELMLLDHGQTSIASLFINLFILLSYPINFFIYCGMSRQFRGTFKGLFTNSAHAGPINERSETVLRAEAAERTPAIEKDKMLAHDVETIATIC